MDPRRVNPPPWIIVPGDLLSGISRFSSSDYRIESVEHTIHRDVNSIDFATVRPALLLRLLYSNPPPPPVNQQIPLPTATTNAIDSD